MRYRDDDICRVYKVVGSGEARVQIGWFDTVSPRRPRFTTFLTPPNQGPFPFGISASCVAAGIAFTFNKEADLGKTDDKYHFEAEGPFIIVRRNSNMVVDPLDCLNVRIDVVGGSGLDDGAYGLLEIPVSTHGAWREVTDPDIDFFDGPIITHSRGMIVTTTMPPTGSFILGAGENIGDEYHISNALASTDGIEIQFESLPISPRTFTRNVIVRPGDSMHIVWDGNAWILDGEFTKHGRFLPFITGTIKSADINVAPGLVSTGGTITLDDTGPHIVGQRFTIVADGGSVTVSGAINITANKFADFVWNGTDWVEEQV